MLRQNLSQHVSIDLKPSKAVKAPLFLRAQPLGELKGAKL